MRPSCLQLSGHWDTRNCSARLSGPTSTWYVVLDIFSRYVVGWMIAHRESAALAKTFNPPKILTPYIPSAIPPTPLAHMAAFA